jgi:hypothetical protein
MEETRMDSTTQWQSNTTKNPIKINLQLFADAGAPSEVPASDAPSPKSFAEAGEMFLRGVEGTDGGSAGTGTEVAGVQAPAQTTDATPDPMKIFRDMGLNKFDAPEKVAKSYIELEKQTTRLAQERAASQRTIAEMQEELARLRATSTPPASTTQGATETTFDPDEFLSKWYENPKEALAPLTADLRNELRKEILSELQPLRQQMDNFSVDERVKQASDARVSAASEFFGANEVSSEFMQQMADILDADPTFYAMTDPEDIKDLMGKTLTWVKGKAYTAAPSIESVVASLLSDEALFNKHIAGNESVRNKLLATAVRDVQSNRTPPMLASSGGATMVTRSADAPKTFEALGESLKKAWGAQ